MRRLLIVEDDGEMLDVLRDILGSLDIEISTARSGSEALSELSNNRFDLALIDLKLGDMSGFDIMRVISEDHPETVMVVLTGFASVDSAVKALEMGAYDYLRKPIHPEILIKTVERGLEKKQFKDLIETVIGKMNEGLVLLNSSGIMCFTNERFPQMLKYSSEELKGKSFLSKVVPEDEDTVRHLLNQARQGEPKKLQCSLIGKDGSELVGIISFTQVGDFILTIVSDVTEILYPPLAGKSLSYRLEPGLTYLVLEEKPRKAKEAFEDLLRAGYRGIVLTRDYQNEAQTRDDTDYTVLHLTRDLSDESTLFPNVSLVSKRIKPYFSAHGVILIDRLDYLISTDSFKSVLGLVQWIRDLALRKRSITILSVDPRTLSEKEVSLLEKETSPLLATAVPEIREDLMELLSYVAKRNEVGARPNHKQIEKRFNITRATVRQRLKLLSTGGLLVEKREGRTRTVEITEKGRKRLRTLLEETEPSYPLQS